MEKMIFRDLIDDFGIPLDVYIPTDGTSGHRDPELGTWVVDTPEPVRVNEPLLPYDSSSQLAVSFTNTTGGTLTEYDMQWFSTHDVPLKTKVTNVSTGKSYEVVNVTPYLDYSDVAIYEVKEVGNE